MRILLLGYRKQKQQTATYEIRKIIRELQKRGHEVNYVYWRELVFSFNKRGVEIKRSQGKDLKYYDFIIPKSPQFGVSKANNGQRKTRNYISHLYRHYLLIVDYINKHHKHILNEKTASKMPFYDKLFQHYLLAKNGLPVAPSYLYTGTQLLKSVYQRFSFPYIAKSIEGSGGKQIFLIENTEQIPELIKEFGIGKILIQKFLPARQDYRIIVIGNKVIGGMRRIAPKGGFKTNFSAGGYVEKINVSKDFKELALKAAKIFKVEFAGIDIMEYKNKLYILEINIFPGFRGFEQATETNVAGQLVSYIEKKYLWSIDSIPSQDKNKKKELIPFLYKIEQENLDGTMKELKFKKMILENELIIVKKEGEPIAYLSYHLDQNKILSISRLVIKKKFIGQRIGRRLIKKLITKGINQKAKKIRSFVNKNNKKRQKSFLRSGFSKKRVVVDYFKTGGNAIIFEYELNGKIKK